MPGARFAAAMLATVGVLAVATPVWAAEQTPVAPWAVGEQMQRVDAVTWDAAGDALLVTGKPAGDTCCTGGLWLARPDGSGTRLDAGGQEIRGASISPDGRTMAWLTPGQSGGRARVVVADSSGARTVTRLPAVDPDLEPYYEDTLIGPTGRVFAVLNTYSGRQIVEIPRGGRGRILNGQPRMRYSSDSPSEYVVRSPDGRLLAFCGDVRGHTVAGTLDAVTGRLRTHRLGRGIFPTCDVTDGGTLAVTTQTKNAQSSLELLPPGHRRRRFRIQNDGVIVGPHAFLVGLSGPRLRVVSESGRRLRRIATPHKFHFRRFAEFVTAWSADGRRAAIAYSGAECPLDRLLIVDIPRRRALRHLTIPGAQRTQSVDDMRFTGDGGRVLFSTSRGCVARPTAAWAVGSRSGVPVNLDGAGFAYTGTWDVPGLGALVAQDRAHNPSASSALGLVDTTAQLGTGPLAMAGG